MNIIKSKYPHQAAKKAFTILAKQMNYSNRNGENYIKFVLKDKTNNKEYPFIGTQVVLNTPKKRVTPNGKTIVYRYRNIVSKYTANMDGVFT